MAAALLISGSMCRAMDGRGWPGTCRSCGIWRCSACAPARRGSGLQASTNCTRLESLQLEGDSAARIPVGRYLKHLTRLDWLCDPHAAEPDAVALLGIAATTLVELKLRLAPERIAMCSALDTLPNLQRLIIVGTRDDRDHENALLRLQQRLRATITYLPQ